jgi:cell division protein FtsB
MHMRKILKYLRNFYFLSTLSFLFWVIFIDSNNLIVHFKLTKKLWELENQKEYFQEKKIQIQQERAELMSNSELLEKFARERYLMKKPTEDLYVIVEK